MIADEDIGFDLVGAEDRPNHIGFYEKELVAFQKTCKEKNLDIPFLFHAGETLLDMGGFACHSREAIHLARVPESQCQEKCLPTESVQRSADQGTS